MPNLSTLTGIQPYLIAERSEATPGLFNNLVSVVSQNVDQINTDAFALSAAAPPGALNAASLPGSGVSQIQAAINKASSLAIPIVYLPTNLLPYAASQISFIYTVQMVREGGDWSELDVRAYGAAGNNIADDSASLTAALNAVTNGTIFNVRVPPGTYRFSSALSPATGTVITGIRGASILSCANSSNVLLLQAISRNSIIVDGISWNAGSQPGINTTSLQFDGCTDVIVRNCAFQNTKIPIWLRGSTTGCQRVLIENNDFSAVSDFAVRANEASFGTDISIRGNYVANVLTNVAVSPTAFALIANRSNVINNVVAATSDSGVIASGAASDILIAGNTVNSTKVSIFAGTGAKRVIVANNILSSVTDFGIDFQGAGAVSDELVAIGNVIHDCGKSGINLEDVNRATVMGNTIARVGQATGNPDQQRCGVSFVQVSNASVKWTSVMGNIIYDDATPATMRYGILVQPTNDFTFVWGNSVQNALVLNINALTPTTNYMMQTSPGGFQQTGPGFFPAGSAFAPALSFGSDNSLGWYRSAASALGLSYGQLQVPLGTSLLPSLAYSSESSLGFYSSGASTIVQSYGTFFGSVLSSATVRTVQAGIGGFQATNMMTVNTDAMAAATVGLRVRGTMTSHTTDFLQVTDAGNADAIAFSVSSVGTTFVNRLGVNTATPALLLDVSNSTDCEIQIKSNSTNSLAAIRLGNFNRRWDIRNDATQTNQPFVIRDASSALDRLRIDSNGQVSVVTAGIATLPALAISSDTSLGFYRSAASTLALSYGTFDLTNGGAVLSIASLRIKSGANNACGTAILGSNGSVNVANTYVKTGDLIFLTDQTAGGTLGDIELGGIRDSSGFTILSTSITDTSTVAWLIVRPT